MSTESQAESMMNSRVVSRLPRLSKAALNLCVMVIAGLLVRAAVAQEFVPELPRFSEAEADITLDGNIDEEIWQRIPAIDGMRVIDPDTLAETAHDTHTRIFYTEEGIYVGVMNFQDPDTLIARMTSRDVRLDRDGFVVGIDSSGTGLYGHFLRINLGDSMTDGTILPERQLNMQWDGSWNGRTAEQDYGWGVEYFIPWSMMALPQAPSGTRQIGIYLERQVGYLEGEAWSYPALPRTVNQYISAFEKYQLRDIEPRTQLTYYPFAATVFDGIKHEFDTKIGTELFWRPTTNTQVSASLNPDFGNVESDDVVVNLTAFEVFFPERRSFFLEGQDIFNASPRTSGRGGPGGPVSLLNTRRIGGAPRFTVPSDVDVIPTDRSRPSDLLGAVKLVGQAGNLRYGTLLASEDDSELRGTLADGTRVQLQAEGRDFAIGRLLYEDTSAGGRRALGWMGTNISHPGIDATVNAMDVHYFSADNKWVMDGQAMYSDVDGVTGAGGFVDVSYRPSRGVNHTLRTTYMDDTLDINDLGFLTRNDQVNMDYSFFLQESNIEGIRGRTTSIFINNQWNTEGQPVRLGLFVNRGYDLLNGNSINGSIRYFPSRIDDRLGRGTGDFRINERYGANIRYETDPTGAISYSVSFNADQEDLGARRLSGSGGVVWRPNDQFSADLRLNYTDREALLVHRGSGNYTSYEATQWSPRLEVNYFITAKQQLRFTGQWTALKAYEDKFWQVNPNQREFLNEVANPDNVPDDFLVSRLTFQARYRWEIAPLSDLFVVYTRGSNLPSSGFDTYADLLERSWNDKIVDTVAIKLRYRLGS